MDLDTATKIVVCVAGSLYAVKTVRELMVSLVSSAVSVGLIVVVVVAMRGDISSIQSHLGTLKTLIVDPLVLMIKT